VSRLREAFEALQNRMYPVSRYFTTPPFGGFGFRSQLVPSAGRGHQDGSFAAVIYQSFGGSREPRARASAIPAGSVLSETGRKGRHESRRAAHQGSTRRDAGSRTGKGNVSALLVGAEPIKVKLFHPEGGSLTSILRP
jgi:hypothetical protein